MAGSNGHRATELATRAAAEAARRIAAEASDEAPTVRSAIEDAVHARDTARAERDVARARASVLEHAFALRLEPAQVAGALAIVMGELEQASRAGQALDLDHATRAAVAEVSGGIQPALTGRQPSAPPTVLDVQREREKYRARLRELGLSDPSLA
ncbi:MAG: hypothetical protein HYY06_31710 [Deltaproteobacteria bacterium]|nr:hypothetical protein [Deltaproteobacteria bacterium]